MLACGEQLQGLLADLFTVSKISENKFSISKEYVSLKDVIGHCAALFAPKAEAKMLGFDNRQDSIPDVAVYTDKNRLIQIVSNILSNAIKFTESGNIKITSKLENDTLSIIIQDTGIGIRNIENVFDVYSQENEQENFYSGSGLGLAIVKKLCADLNHGLNFQSDVGKGTTVTITISDINHKAKGEEVPAPQVDLDKTVMFESVLIVDDNSINRDIAESMLTDMVQHIDQVENGLEALKAVDKRLEYSLILMDLNMPVMDGYQASQAIKRITSNTVIIAVSADTDEAALEKTKQAGIDFFLQKPFTRAQLLELLKKIALCDN
jgi:CheY-like chemotaxis protein